MMLTVSNIQLLVLFCLVIICLVVWYYYPNNLHVKRRFNYQNAEKASKKLLDQLHDEMIKEMLITKSGDKNKNNNAIKIEKNKDRVYIFKNSDLLKSAKAHLGMYSSPNSWIYAYMGCKNMKVDNLTQGYLQFINHYQADIDYYFVYYDGKYFNWLKLDKAFNNTNLPISKRARAKYDAYQILMQHFNIQDDINIKAVISWVNYKTCYENDKFTVYDDLIIDNQSSVSVIRLKNMQDVVGCQIYEDKKLYLLSRAVDSPITVFKAVEKKAKELMQIAEEGVNNG